MCKPLQCWEIWLRPIPVIILFCVSQVTNAQSWRASDITDLILVTGQSNVQGSLTASDPDPFGPDAKHPRVFAYTDKMDWDIADLRQAWDMNGWHPGNGSLNDPSRSPYNNFAFHFAKNLVSNDTHKVVGIIVASAPGKGIAHWDTNKQFWAEIDAKVTNAINAQGSLSKLTGILWHQGETDWLRQGSSDPEVLNAPTDYYPHKLAQLINNFRTKPWFDSTSPFICGETKAAELNIHLMSINSDADPWTACVPASDLPTREGDTSSIPPVPGTHFNAVGLRALGQRYGSKYIELIQGNKNDANDSVRASQATNIISALESYASDNGSFLVSGTGHNGSGQGWFHHGDGAYTNSIFSGISQYLNDTPADPLHSDTSVFSANDFMVYRCNDRIAVFAKTDSLLPSSDDINWWTLHNCPTFPIDNYDHKFFKLSQSLDLVYHNSTPDLNRQLTVKSIVDAIEGYASDNGSFLVTGHGHNGSGQGWFHYSDGAYTNSIFSGISQYLSSIPADPLHTDLNSFSSNDFMVYQCKDRIAVFARTDSLLPSNEHQSWWLDNSCPTFPVTTYNHNYYYITQPLTSVIGSSLDNQRHFAVTEIINALEKYQNDFGSFIVSGHGHSGGGQGWFHYDQGAYTDSIFNGLSSYLSGIPADPLHTDTKRFSKNDFMIYHCKNRVAVFAKTQSLQPSGADQFWWTNNNCPTFPISKYDKNFFITTS